MALTRQDTSGVRPRTGPTRTCAGSRLGGLPARVLGNELCDRADLLVGQLALERRHHALAVRDALAHERLVGLRLVEVRPDCAARPGGREGVAGRAVRREDRLAVVGPT